MLNLKEHKQRLLKNKRIDVNRSTSFRLVATSAILVVLFATIVCTIGCASQINQNGDDGNLGVDNISSSRTYTIGYSDATFEPELIIAKEKGIFDEYGLSVELEVLSQSSVEALNSGVVDFAIGSPVTVNAIREGLDASVIDAVHAGGVQVISYPENGISSMDDLVGGKIAICDTSSESYVVARAALAQQGIDVNNIEWIDYSSSGLKDAVRALYEGEVDALAWENLCGSLLNWVDFQCVFDSASDDNYGGCAQSFLIAANDALDDSTEDVSQLCLALEEATQFIEQNPTEAVQILKDSDYVSGYSDMIDDWALAAAYPEALADMITSRRYLTGEGSFELSMRQCWVTLYYADDEFCDEIEIEPTSDLFFESVDSLTDAVSQFCG